jgi:hypothetical protein
LTIVHLHKLLFFIRIVYELDDIKKDMVLAFVQHKETRDQEKSS